jgi:hypothetical protein
MNMRLDAREIARMIPMFQMLRHLGWRVRSRNRADCGLCRGTSKGTLAFTERLWRCHRCNEGGDVYSLVRAVHRCDFRTALAYVAEFAGVQIGGSTESVTDVQRNVEVRQRERKRIERAAETLAAMEHSIRCDCRDRIHACDNVLSSPGPWDEAHWQRAWAATVLRDEHLLPAFLLLSFGAMAERTLYVLADWQTRAEMAAGVRMAGGVRTDNGHWREVVA